MSDKNITYIKESRVSKINIKSLCDEDQMCLQGYMQLEYADIKEWLDEIKSNIII